MGPTITGYQVQYKETTDTSYTLIDNITETATTISPQDGIEAATSYQVRVRATNDDGDGLWSLVGTGSTNKEDNSPPTFGASAVVTRNVSENTPAGEDVDAPVTADDNDATTLAYQLEGPDADSFGFDTSSGQIRTKSPLNHEDRGCGYNSAVSPTTCTYKVTVMVTDGAGGSDAIAVDITVSDSHEPVLAPARPTVRPTDNWSTRLDISWNAPANTGPPITGYAVRYRQDSTGAFSNDDCGSVDDDNCDSITGTKTTIFRLTAGESHQVQVMTIIAGGRKSIWSDSGTGSTNAANKEPRFDDRPSSGSGSARGDNYTTSRTVDENTPSNRPVGGAVRAEDGDGHPRTYDLVAANADQKDFEKFDINKSTGQILTKEPLNYEDADCVYSDSDNTTTCIYTVKVEVRDGYDTHKVKVKSEAEADDAITVTINVRDKEEIPEVPTVMVTSPVGNMTLVVTWDEPENTGPTPITYDVQHRKGSGAFSNDNCEDIPADNNCDGLLNTTTTITGLDENTSYSVQVRARNDEGPSRWSHLVTVKTNKGINVPPAFAPDPSAFTVPENTGSGQIVGNAVSATDDDSETVRHSLGGADAASFNFNTRTGAITTRSSLNFEEKASYSVRVRANDGTDGGSASHNVTITVTDAVEPPIPPAAPRVIATQNSGWSLDVTWNEPGNTGKPPITDYDIQYRKLGEGNNAWVPWPHGDDSARDDTGNTKRTTKITRVAAEEDAAHLEPRTQYEVEVQATNEEGTSDWSRIGRGTTGAGNSRPSSDRPESLVTLNVAEDTLSGQPVGSAVSATDADSNSLTYSLEGPGANSFTIVSSSGQIRTKSPLDYETRSSYSVTVKVDDGSRRANSSAAKSVTIKVGNVDEIPPPPGAPTVSGIPGSTDSVRVTWDASANTGPAITDYEVRYGEAGSGGWTTLVGRSGADRSQIITGLTAGTRYEVQVRAKSAEGTGEWSASGSGSPDPDETNNPPTFFGGPRTFSVAENTDAGANIGSPVTATDPDRDPLTYTLEGTAAASFDIAPITGQIRTRSPLNHEAKDSYAVTVKADDRRGGADTIRVTITVTDVDGEAPATPAAPTVAAASSTSLAVSWDAPENTGPPITDYDYQYREASGSWTKVTNTTITATMVTIPRLTASTSYDVEVRATNAEGTSGWSPPGIGSTNAPGANNPPVFREGASATRSVSANAAANSPIGLPVTATDSDPGDTLNYSLAGADAASFNINPANGQLLTKVGVALSAGTTYTVVVVATDGIAEARITVTVTISVVTNNPPTFSAIHPTRSVAENTPAGANIGSPISATDPDQGDTLTYTLAGNDAASFDIVATTGQLQTKSDLDYEMKSGYSVMVTATDPSGASDTITVTISVMNLDEPPDAPAEPRVTETPASDTSLEVSWTAPSNPGPPITDYDVQYREGSSRAFTPVPSSDINVADRTATITGLTTGATYEVQVRATNADGTGPWSDSGMGMPSVNNPPAFSAARTTRSVEENTAAGTDIDPPVSATDPNADDTLTYILSGPDAASFDILPGTGQLRTKAALDYETKFSYSVTITVSDGEFTDTITVTITVTDMHPGCASAVGNGANTGLANDCEALLDSKATLQGPTGSLNWATFTPIAQWDGITLRGTPKRVTRLLLRKMPQLNGTIPGALGRLNGLENLSLYANGLTGPIPAELGNLSRLKVMYINNNNLSGTIPAELGNLNNLERLWLHRNRLSGSIPTQLGSLTNLEWLSIYGNSLSGSILTRLGRLSKLKVLYLHVNQLSGSIPTQLGSLTNLQLLYLWGNRLTGAIPTELGSLSNLRVLSLGRNQLTGAIPTELGNLSNLERLYVYGDKTQSLSLTGGIPTELGNLTKLTTLVLEYTGLTGAIPSELGRMTDLVWLNLQNNQLNGAIPSSLGSLSNLERLYLHYNQLSGTIPSALGNLSELTNLWLKSNQLSGNIPASLGNLANLERVRISRNPLLTGCVPAALTDSGGADSDAEYLNLPTCQ